MAYQSPARIDKILLIAAVKNDKSNPNKILVISKNEMKRLTRIFHNFRTHQEKQNLEIFGPRRPQPQPPPKRDELRRGELLNSTYDIGQRRKKINLNFCSETIFYFARQSCTKVFLCQIYLETFRWVSTPPTLWPVEKVNTVSSLCISVKIQNCQKMPSAQCSGRSTGGK